MDGDGLDDLLVGSPHASPVVEVTDAAFLVRGAADLAAWGSGSIGERAFLLAGTAAGDEAGVALVAGGGDDIDGAGLDDLLIAAPFGNDMDDAGYVALVLGPAQGVMPLFEAAEAVIHDTCRELGLSLASPGDLDGDGHGDLAIGAGWASCGVPGDHHDLAGEYLFVPGDVHGERDIDDARSGSIYPDDCRGFGGAEVQGAGDLDEDGATDLLVTLHGYPDHAENRGATFLLFGPFRGDVAVGDLSGRRYEGGAAGDHYGYSAALGGDVDGDGRTDLISGAKVSDRGAEGGGMAEIVLLGAF